MSVLGGIILVILTTTTTAAIATTTPSCKDNAQVPSGGEACLCGTHPCSAGEWCGGSGTCYRHCYAGTNGGACACGNNATELCPHYATCSDAGQCLTLSPTPSPTTDRPDLWAWLSGHTDEAIAQIKANRDIVTDISMGGYAVDASGGFSGGGPNATLVAELQSMGIRVWPLIGCGSSSTLRSLFANPGPFINAAVKEAARLNVAGFNLDFEPYDGHGVAEDGFEYGTFLGAFADALHAASPPRKLSLDYFSNLPLPVEILQNTISDRARRIAQHGSEAHYSC